MSDQKPKKSPAYIEALLREAVVHVEACIQRPLKAAGFDGLTSGIQFSDAQHDFLAGYIYGALRRLLELGELDERTDVEQAASRLYERIVGLGQNEIEPWHSWVVNEGLQHLNRPHVFLGFCAGRNDIVARLRRSNFRSALGPALLNLSGRDGSLPLAEG